jgi:methionyl aminopeptidase
MGIIKTKSEIEKIRYSAKVVAEILEYMKGFIKEGITSLEIDEKVESMIKKSGGSPAFKGWYDYPNATCISINNSIIHGIPDKTIIKNGDLVSLDIGVESKKAYGDAAYTYLVGEVSEDKKQLARVTEESLYLGIEQAIVGNRVGDIGNAVQTHVEKYNYGIVRDYCGHGVGLSLWEEPQIPNYGTPGRGRRFKENMCICIEPMINLGTGQVLVKDDGWTVVTKDGKASAHYEHQILITGNGPEILSKV